MAAASCAMLATDYDPIALITSPHVALVSALSQHFQTSLQHFYDQKLLYQVCYCIIM